MSEQLIFNKAEAIKEKCDFHSIAFPSRRHLSLRMLNERCEAYINDDKAARESLRNSVREVL